MILCMDNFLNFGEGALVLATMGSFPSHEMQLLSFAVTGAALTTFYNTSHTKICRLFQNENNFCECKFGVSCNELYLVEATYLYIWC